MTATISRSETDDRLRSPGRIALAGALDGLKFDAILEAADLAGNFADIVSEAAARGDDLRVRAYAALLSRATRNVLVITAELATRGEQAA